MLKLNPNPTFKVPVKIALPDGSEKQIKVEFRHKGRKALEEWLASAVDGENKPVRNDIDLLKDVIADWEGVDAKYSEDNLDLLADNYPSSVRALIDAYIPALTEGRVKN